MSRKTQNIICTVWFLFLVVFVVLLIIDVKEQLDNAELVQEPKEKIIIEKIVVPEFTQEEVYLLAQCVEAEAGIGNRESQKYITQVILNRINSDVFPNSIEEVIFQKNGDIPQFCVAYNGAMNREVEAETLVNVYEVLMYGTNLPNYVLYFYSDIVEDNWVNTLNTYEVVEGTVFAYAE